MYKCVEADAKGERPLTLPANNQAVGFEASARRGMRQDRIEGVALEMTTLAMRLGKEEQADWQV